MPRVNGVYSLPPVYFAENGTTIMPQQHNDPLQDIAAALTASLPRDGSAGMNGNLPMNGRKVTGLASGTAPQDAATFGQIPVLSPFVKSMSSLNMVANRIIYSLNDTTAAMAICTAFGRSVLELTNAAGARTLFGLGTLATESSINNSNWSGTRLSIENGGTSAITPGAARNNLGAAALTTTITAGNGLAGGGSLAADRTVSLALTSLPLVSTLDTPQFVMTNGASSGTESRVGSANARSILNISTNAQAVWNTGTDTAEATISALKLETKLQAKITGMSIGYGQTWTNVLGSRTIGTSYRNETNSPIMVSVTADGNNADPCKFEISTNGSSWVQVAGFGEEAFMHAQVIVPNGHYYRVYAGQGLKGWAELR